MEDALRAPYAGRTGISCGQAHVSPITVCCRYQEQGSQHSDALLRRLPLRLASCTVCVRVDDGHNFRAQGRLCNHRSLSTRLAKGIRLLPHYTKSFVGSCPASEDSRGSTQSFDQAFMSMLRSCFMLLLFIQSHAGHLRQDHSKTLGQASKLPV